MIDMRGKVGRVKALIDLGDGLPRATVEWLDVGESTMPLGYLESAERGGLE